MKKLTLILCVVAAIALFGTMFAQAATPPQKQSPAQHPKAEKQIPAQTAKPAMEKKMMEKTTAGTIVSIDAVANRLVMKGKKSEMTVQVAPTTKIMIAGKEAKLADIKKDSKVTITYKWEGKTRVATVIKTR